MSADANSCKEDKEDDSDEEKLYCTDAPTRRIDFEDFRKYKNLILEDCYHHYYVTTDWNPKFYKILAFVGFISVSQGDYLIPEIQTYYCILDFVNIKANKKCLKVIKRYMKASGAQNTVKPLDSTGELVFPIVNQAAEAINGVAMTSVVQSARTGKVQTLILHNNKNSKLCIKKIQEYWGDQNWLSEKYVDCLYASGVQVHTIELYLEQVEDGVSSSIDATNNIVASHTLIAGEIGYSIGSVYTSLTGYCEKGTSRTSLPKDIFLFSDGSAVACNDYVAPPDTSSSDIFGEVILQKDLYRCCGSIQLYCLGKWLDSVGYHFWNLGHPPRRKSMRYKRDLGGLVYPRTEFLSRWNEARSNPLPSVSHNSMSSIMNTLEAPRG